MTTLSDQKHLFTLDCVSEDESLLSFVCEPGLHEVGVIDYRGEQFVYPSEKLRIASWSNTHEMTMPGLHMQLRDLFKKMTGVKVASGELDLSAQQPEWLDIKVVWAAGWIDIQLILTHEEQSFGLNADVYGMEGASVLSDGPPMRALVLRSKTSDLLDALCDIGRQIEFAGKIECANHNGVRSFISLAN